MMSTGSDSQAVHDELRRIEGEVVQGERQLAEKEKLLVTLRGQNEESKIRAELEMMLAQQREREQQRQQFLAMLRP
jgi:hypothetical protein